MSNSELIISVITLVACAIVMVTIGGIITGEYADLNRYSSANCSGIDNTFIGNTLGYYHCHGYVDIYYNGSIVGSAKLENPPYNYLIIKVTESECNTWLSSLTDDKFHTCYVDNMYSTNANGYTNLQSVTGYIAMMVIGGIILAIGVLVVIFNIISLIVISLTRTGKKQIFRTYL